MKLYLYSPERKLYLGEEEWLDEHSPSENVFMDIPVHSTWVSPGTIDNSEYNYFWNEERQSWVKYRKVLAVVSPSKKFLGVVESSEDYGQWAAYLAEGNVFVETIPNESTLKEYHEFVYENSSWSQKPVGNIKAIFKEETESVRNKKLEKGFTYNTKRISMDSVSQSNLLSFFSTGNAGLLTYPVEWRTKENDVLRVDSFDSLKKLSMKMLAEVQKIYKESWIVKDKIENATEEEAISILNNYKGTL